MRIWIRNGLAKTRPMKCAVRSGNGWQTLLSRNGLQVQSDALNEINTIHSALAVPSANSGQLFKVFILDADLA